MDGVRTVLLIPYFNAMPGLVRSLSSVGPSERCDALIVDDGSGAIPLDEDMARAAFRGAGSVYVLRQPANRGIEYALNAGLDWILQRDYTYVARLDCGDENVPDRLIRQEKFLDAHPDVLLLGGAAEFVDESGRPQFVLRMPTDMAGIKARMRHNSAFMHPSVMMRTSALTVVGRYPTDAPAAEDYEFFWRFMEAGETANLPDVLIRYVLDPGGISLSRRRTQLASRRRIQLEHNDGSPRALAGVARTLILEITPYRVVHRLKRARLRLPAA